MEDSKSCVNTKGEINYLMEKKTSVLEIVLVFGLIVAVGLAAYWYGKSKSKDEVSGAQELTPTPEASTGAMVLSATSTVSASVTATPTVESTPSTTPSITVTPSTTPTSTITIKPSIYIKSPTIKIVTPTITPTPTTIRIVTPVKNLQIQY